MRAGSDSQLQTQASYGEDGESVEWWNMCWRKVPICRPKPISQQRSTSS